MDNPKNTKTKSIGAKVTPEKHRELTVIAKAQGRTVSDIVREQLEDYVRDWERVKDE